MKSPLKPAQVRENVLLGSLSTVAVGGHCRYFAEVQQADLYPRLRKWTAANCIPLLHIGDASNILFPDEDYLGLVVRNRIRGRRCDGEEVQIGGGENLSEVIRWLNSLELAGLERMYGIPGSVAGAIVGNAGAFGQEIKDVLVSLTATGASGIQRMKSSEIGFSYRHSRFKEERDYFITSCTLRLRRSRDPLQEISESILQKRLAKYPAGLRCPGSFFKNVPVAELDELILERVPREFVQSGKIVAAKLLEAVGAKGARRGDARFADYHANLLINNGRASGEDILSLAGEYSRKVYERFGVTLEPEILIVKNEKRFPYRKGAFA